MLDPGRDACAGAVEKLIIGFGDTGAAPHRKMVCSCALVAGALPITRPRVPMRSGAPPSTWQRQVSSSHSPLGPARTPGGLSTKILCRNVLGGSGGTFYPRYGAAGGMDRLLQRVWGARLKCMLAGSLWADIQYHIRGVRRPVLVKDN